MTLPILEQPPIILDMKKHKMKMEIENLFIDGRKFQLLKEILLHEKMSERCLIYDSYIYG